MNTGKLSIKTRAETVQVPIVVVFRATPCVWEVRRTPSKKLGQGPGTHSRPRFFARRAGSSGQLYEAWDVRQAFLELRTEEDFLHFLNQYGRFSPKADYAGLWELRDLRGWQQVFRDLMTHSPATWKEYLEKLTTEKPEFNARRISLALNDPRRFTIQFFWKGSARAAILHTQNVVMAIFATIHIDHLAGTKFRMCARPDCSKFFEITSKHKRKYCSQYCGHFESLRRTRKRQKKGRRKLGHQ